MFSVKRLGGPSFPHPPMLRACCRVFCFQSYNIVFHYAFTWFEEKKKEESGLSRKNKLLS